MQEFEIRKKELDFRSKEAFKTLRTNIEFSGDDVRVICITSAMPNEGKSSISFELAQSFAMAGKKTILIDADLRKSVMRTHYRRGNVKYGLTNYLAGKKEFDEVFCMTDVENFFMVFSGPVPPNPSELLGGERFSRLIAELRETYDLVIIDTPPVGSVIDASIVSKNTDGVVVVLSNGAISYKFARKIKEQLDTAGAKVLGCVLNKVNLSGNKYYGKYYGNYYGNYGSDSSKDSDK